jgi:serine/threonine protein phosphatase PrpC
VEGQLAVSRAFGDHCLKDKGVIANPYIEKVELRLIDKYLVMGSDGLWDSLEDQESIDVVKTKDSAGDMAKSLVTTALAKFSKDNVSCMVLKL